MDFNDFMQNAQNFGAGNASGKKIARVWGAFVEKLRENPNIWLSVLQEAQSKQMQIVAQLGNPQAPPVVQPERGDRRFDDPQWQSNAFFSFLAQSYLLNCQTLLRAVELADMPQKDKGVLRFVARQYCDSISPANFPATNPQVYERAVATGGESLAQGMRNLAQDIQLGAVSNTDANAFAVGKNLATTPGKVVAQTPVMQLIEYAPQTAKTHATPLLVVPPFINKYYILDLTPQKSLVRALVAAGHRVFLISWVNAAQEHARLNWDDYLRLGIMTALRVARAVGKSAQVNTLGYCVGGTALCCALAALAAEGERPAKSVTLLASMLDFSDSGEIGLFIDEDSAQEDERRYANGGLVDGMELRRLFAALRPNELLWPYVIDNYYKGETPPAFDLLFWNADAANIPGPLFAQYKRFAYLENQIAKGGAVMCGAPIKLQSIKAPVYAVACEKDHIVPWQTAYKSARLLANKAVFVLSASGHIAGIVNPPAKGKGWHLVAPASAALPAAAEKWQSAAAKKDGSWWPHWLGWLGKRGGGMVAAVKKQGNVEYAPQEDAPGGYVSAARVAVAANGEQQGLQQQQQQQQQQQTNPTTKEKP